MRELVCNLIRIDYVENDIGVQKEVRVKTECPVIKTESIYAREFYQAHEQGFKPTLRLRISSLNYNDEEELEYMDKVYTIIRTEDLIDELILVCQRKVKNVKGSYKPSI